MIQRSPCLGARISALADGSLPDDVRDRALAHVTGCAPCREALDTERLLVARVRELPAPGPSEALMARLLAMGETGGPLPPRPGRVAGTARPPSAVVVGRAPAGHPAARATTPSQYNPGSQSTPGSPSTPRPPRLPAVSVRPPSRREHRRSRRVLAAAAGVLGVGVIAVTALGSSLPSSGPGVVPPVDQLTVQHGVTVRENPFSDAGLVHLVTPGTRATAVPVLLRVETGR